MHTVMTKATKILFAALAVFVKWGSALECYTCAEIQYGNCGRANRSAIEIHQCRNNALGCFAFGVDPTSGTIMNTEPVYMRGCIDRVQSSFQPIQRKEQFCSQTRTPGQNADRWECTVCNQNRCNGNVLRDIQPLYDPSKK